MNQPTTRQINSHLFAGTGYCVVYTNGWQARIGYVRTRKGVREGRVINITQNSGCLGPVMKADRIGLRWITIPEHARVELS